MGTDLPKSHIKPVAPATLWECVSKRSRHHISRELLTGSRTFGLRRTARLASGFSIFLLALTLSSCSGSSVSGSHNATGTNAVMPMMNKPNCA